MKKRLMSLFLVLALIFSMTACGSKTPAKPTTVQGVVESIAAFDLNTMSYVMDMDMGDQGSLSMKMDVSTKSQSEGYLGVSAKFDINGLTVEEYMPVTTIYVADKNMYINLQQVLDFVASLDSQLAAMTSYLALPGEYLAVSMDEIVSYLEAMGFDTAQFEIAESAVTLSSDDQKKMTEANVALFGGFLQELADKSGTATVTDGIATFEISAVNMQAFMNALAEMDIEKYLTDYAAALEAIPGASADAESFRDMAEGLNQKVDEAAAALKVEEMKSSNIKAVFGAEEIAIPNSKDKKKNAFIDFTMLVDDGTDVMNLAFYIDMSEDKAGDYALPESTMTLDELMQMLNNLGLLN